MERYTTLCGQDLGDGYGNPHAALASGKGADIVFSDIQPEERAWQVKALVASTQQNAIVSYSAAPKSLLTRQCGYSTEQKEDYIDHVHENHLRTMCSWGHCKETFDNSTALLEHLRKHNDRLPEGRLVCRHLAHSTDVLGRGAFSSEVELQQHLHRCHNLRVERLHYKDSDAVSSYDHWFLSPFPFPRTASRSSSTSSHKRKFDEYSDDNDSALESSGYDTDPTCVSSD
ncbi:hypothetical protein F5B20DRAFT_595910 [Whalleya microplaca]|nr:hypothetical protein F5B20DRAFT_595910 [Whalleya microplaca]